MVEWRVPASTGKPWWLRVRVRSSRPMATISSLVRGGVTTVCSESLCPNLPLCWGRGEATFMLLGDTCTRSCGFCAVKHGFPQRPSSKEPENVARLVANLRLRYVVLTSVDRDDLLDGGAGVFAETVRAIKKLSPGTIVEVLTPDFWGSCRLVEEVVEAGVDVFAHNVETVERLTPTVRDPRASYHVSLKTLRCAREAGVVVKTGVMLGLGEELEDLEKLFGDVAGLVDILTMGQYLRPTPRNLPVKHYVTPEGFRMLAEKAREKGVPVVVAGPFVRSSFASQAAYRAALEARKTGKGKTILFLPVESTT